MDSLADTGREGVSLSRLAKSCDLGLLPLALQSKCLKTTFHMSDPAIKITHQMTRKYGPRLAAGLAAESSRRQSSMPVPNRCSQGLGPAQQQSQEDASKEAEGPAARCQARWKTGKLQAQASRRLATRNNDPRDPPTRRPAGAVPSTGPQPKSCIQAKERVLSGIRIAAQALPGGIT